MTGRELNRTDLFTVIYKGKQKENWGVPFWYCMLRTNTYRYICSDWLNCPMGDQCAAYSGLREVVRGSVI